MYQPALNNSYSGQAPNKPGVYIIKDRSDKVIYVGKAISIAKRVPAHFRPDSKLAGHIANLDYIVTSNELEALILEAVLIKKYHPKYNVLLRDDKQYPYIKLTLNEEWPRILLVRKIENDGAKYYGPYMSSTVRDIFRVVKRLFQIRWCKTFRTKSQPCFYYHLGKCLAPCAGNATKEEYMKAVADIRLFLEGKYGPAISKLKEEMKKFSQNREYEAAAKTRDKLRMFENFSEEQKVVTASKKDRDVFSLVQGGSAALVLVLEIRSGKVTGKNSYFIKDIKETEDLLGTSAIQYYAAATYIPDEIIMDAKDVKMLQAAISKIKNGKVKISRPRNSLSKGLFRMAQENAEVMLQQNLQKLDGNYRALFELKEHLKMEKLPFRIEAFDISTTMGIETVGSMAVFEGGEPLKSDYRKFKVAPGRKANNDVAGIRNVVMRRFTGKLATQLETPDLVLIDGGKGQLNAARPFIPKGTLVIGLAKKMEEIFLPGENTPLSLPLHSPSLKVLRRIRDEAHRFAITFHRKRRGKRMFSSGQE
jgi:excinuclease ABC subunit C